MLSSGGSCPQAGAGNGAILAGHHVGSAVGCGNMGRMDVPMGLGELSGEECLSPLVFLVKTGKYRISNQSIFPRIFLPLSWQAEACSLLSRVDV